MNSVTEVKCSDRLLDSNSSAKSSANSEIFISDGVVYSSVSLEITTVAATATATAKRSTATGTIQKNVAISFSYLNRKLSDRHSFWYLTALIASLLFHLLFVTLFNTDQYVSDTECPLLLRLNLLQLS